MEWEWRRGRVDVDVDVDADVDVDVDGGWMGTGTYHPLLSLSLSLSLARSSLSQPKPSSKLPNLPTCQPAPLSILPPRPSLLPPNVERTLFGLRGACPEATNPSCPSTDSSHPSVNIQRANIIHTPHHSHSYPEAATSAYSSQAAIITIIIIIIIIIYHCRLVSTRPQAALYLSHITHSSHYRETSCSQRSVPDAAVLIPPT